MDTFENIQQPGENQPPRQETVREELAPEESIPYRGAGAGRKESPFANSPFMMANEVSQPRNEMPRYEPAWEQTEHQPQEQTDYQSQGFAGQSQGNAYQQSYYSMPQQPVTPKKPKVKKPKGFWKKPLAAALAVAVVIGSCAITGGIVNSGWKKQAAQMEKDFNTKLTQIQEQLDGVSQKADQQIVLGTAADGHLMTPAQVYAKNVETVVMVYSTVAYYNYGQQSSGTSTGSGFIISKDGYILTNHHVIEGATQVSVVTHDGTKYQAAIVGSDATNDVALLKVDAKDLPTAELGSSDNLIVGDQVVAIGNPLGELTSTMTVGYVSGKERAVTTDGATIDMIQTDAAINSGNSGGPLFNMLGQVVGITTAKYSGQSASGASIEGIGFAIPMDDVMEVVSDLLEYGYVKSAYMGITIREIDADLAGLYNLPAGVYVESVEPGGPAAAAGMQAQDIIIELGGKSITSYNDLSRALREFEPGDRTTVTIYRSGMQYQLTIVLGEKPQTTSVPQTPQPGEGMPEEGSFEDWFKYFEPFFD